MLIYSKLHSCDYLYKFSCFTCPPTRHRSFKLNLDKLESQRVRMSGQLTNEFILLYFNFRFISHNPLDCDHVTTRTLKYTLRETMKLKAFDGHKIKCPQMVTIMKNPFMAPNPMPRPHYHYHDVSPDRCLTPGKIVAVVCLTMFGLAAFAILCWLLTSTRYVSSIGINSSRPNSTNSFH